MVLVKGTGIVQKIKKTKHKAIITINDGDGSELHLSVPYSKKTTININDRVCFDGVFDDESFVEVDFITKAYLEPLGFKIESKGEEVFSFEKKEKYFRNLFSTNIFDLKPFVKSHLHLNFSLQFLQIYHLNSQNLSNP